MTTATDTSSADAPELDYSTAVAELEEILTELEDEALNVDILTERVKRASELITFCRDRITSAKLGVEQIVADLEELGDAE